MLFCCCTTTEEQGAEEKRELIVFLAANSVHRLKRTIGGQILPQILHKACCWLAPQTVQAVVEVSVSMKQGCVRMLQ